MKSFYVLLVTMYGHPNKLVGDTFGTSFDHMLSTASPVSDSVLCDKFCPLFAWTN